MRKIVLILVLLAPLLVFSQAKKPTIMVVPSDSYCVGKGFFTKQNINGVERIIPDYRKTLQNEPEIRLVITKMAAIMADRGFPLKDLEQELKKIDNESTEIVLLESDESGASVKEDSNDIIKRTAKADIIMDIDIQTKISGPEKYVVFNLRAIDAYTNKQIAGAAGQGSPSSAAGIDILLEEAVVSHMDNFNGRLMSYFNDMFENGREVSISLRTWDNSDVSFNSTFDIDGESTELSEAISDWLADKCVNGRFSTSDKSNSLLKFEQVRIPVFYMRKGKKRAMDTDAFVRMLRDYLKESPFNIDAKVYQKGLGEAWLIIGEK